MIIFCVVLLFTFGRCSYDQRYSTKTVHVGEDVTLTCSRQSSDTGYLFWVKLAAGNLPEVVGATYTFDNANVNKTPRTTAEQKPGTFVLHITKTEPSDTAFYYCEKKTELQTTLLNITFLRVKGPETDVTAIVQNFSSDPVQPGDSVTLQCSVFSDSDSRTCPAGHSVYWFRAGSDKSHPILIYAHGNSGDECETSPETRSLQKCVYNFSKNNVSSSDAGIYYCAVATCGQILFGDGTALDIDASNAGSFNNSHGPNLIIFLLSTALALSVIVIALLIYTIKKNNYDFFNGAAAVQTNAATTTGDQQSQHVNEDSVVYSMPVFSKRKAGQNVRREADTVARTRNFADVRDLGYE